LSGYCGVAGVQGIAGPPGKFSRKDEMSDMKNIDMNVEGEMLIIKIDLSKDLGPSSSGKTILIATTEGNIDVQQGRPEKIGLNIYRKK
jgi:hypothetical protein